MIEKALEGKYLEISEVQENEQDALLVKKNVVGVGIGNKITKENDTGNPSLSVFVSQKLDLDIINAEDLVPKTFGKFQTDVVETGEIFAGMDVANNVEDASTETLRNRIRPARGGDSVGHYRITAGTIATTVTDAKPYPGIPEKYYVLSNNHVLANSNNARIGDPILQSGPADGGTYPGDLIARLSRYVPIRFGGSPNYVDAAIAEGQFHDLDRDIYWIGYVKGVRAVRVGEIVQKTGRTTNHTTGRVTAINATVNVNYGHGRIARMVRQILTTRMSAPGDSGSLLCDLNENAVGLLFAGSSRFTIHNDIMYVQRLLGIRIA